MRVEFSDDERVRLRVRSSDDGAELRVAVDERIRCERTDPTVNTPIDESLDDRDDGDDRRGGEDRDDDDRDDDDARTGMIGTGSVAIVVATTGTTTVAMARAVTDRPWARLLTAAAPVVLGLAALGCTDDGASGVDSLAPLVTAGAPSSTATAPLAPTTAPPAPGSTAPPAAAPPTTVAPPVDGAAVLSAAVAAMAPGYHYRSTVTVDGVVAVEADGDRVGDGTRLGVTRDGTSVQYVITPDGTWVMTDGGEWDQLDTPAATSDPIAALAAPIGRVGALVESGSRRRWSSRCRTRRSGCPATAPPT